MSILDSFFVALGFQVDSSDVDKFQSKAEQVRATMLRVGAVMGGAAIGLGLFVEKMAESLGTVQDFAELNKLSAREVAAFSKIAVENHMAMSDGMDAMESINRKIGEAAAGIGRGKMLFEKLGMSARKGSGEVKTFNEFLDELAEKMKGKSRAENIAIAGRLGINPKWVLLLEKGAEGMRKLREEAEAANPLSDEDYQRAEEVEKLFVKAKNTAGLFAKMFAVQLFPYVKRLLDKYMEWFKQVRKSEQLKTVFQVLAAVVGTLGEWFLKLVTTLKDGIDWLMQWKVVLAAAGVVIAGLLAYQIGAWFIALGEAIWAATEAMTAFDVAAGWPVILIGLLIAAVALLADELYTWAQGGDSYFGVLTDKFPVILKWMRAIGDGVMWLYGVWMDIWGALKQPLGDLMSALWELCTTLFDVLAPIVKFAFQQFWDSLQLVWPLLAWVGKLLFTGIVGAIKAVIEGIALAARVITGFINLVAKAVGGVGKLLGLTNGANVEVTANSLQQAAYPAAQGSATPAGTGVLGRGDIAQPLPASHTSTTNVNIPGGITVISPDPEKAGESVKKELQKAHRTATRNGQSAVAL